jgi:hypothetical protein
MTRRVRRHPQCRDLQTRLAVQSNVSAPLGPRGAGPPAPRGQGHAIEVPRPASAVDPAQGRSSHDPDVVGGFPGVGPVIGRDVLDELRDAVESQ